LRLKAASIAVPMGDRSDLLASSDAGRARGIMLRRP
jgi:hypothetical protein